jgi:hypothetical protein
MTDFCGVNERQQTLENKKASGWAGFGRSLGCCKTV